jgi:hypothetical protein
MSTLYWVLECEPDVGSQGRRNHIFQKPFHNNLGAGYYSSKSEYRSIAQTVFKPRDDEKEDLELVLGIISLSTRLRTHVGPKASRLPAR